MKSAVFTLLLFSLLSVWTFAQNGVAIYHTVKRGENIRQISQQYKTTPKAILKLNKSIPVRKIKAGTKLLIRYASKEQVKKAIRLYKIQKGDNAKIIAKKLGITEAKLKRKMASQDLDFKEGTEITIEENNKEISDSDQEEMVSIAKKDNEAILSDIEVDIPKAKVKKPNAVAVIIGNKNYSAKDVPEVSYAHKDAQLFKKYLINTLGYDEGNIIYVEDATQANFFSFFGNESTHKGKLYDYLRPNESEVFIYYNGHGGPDPETKEAYFVPTDCDPAQLSLNGYSLNTFYKNLSLLPYKSITVVIDACFSGVSEGGALLKNISPIFIDTENKIKLDEKAVVISASASDQVASWYPEKQHSLLSYFLLKAMQGAADSNKDQMITIAEIDKYLSEEVPYWARRLHSREQNPEIWGNPITTFSTY